MRIIPPRPPGVVAPKPSAPGNEGKSVAARAVMNEAAAIQQMNMKRIV